MRTALTIAGSDSSGGAGIQADIKTMISNGVYAMSAITALTAQNTTGVTGIMEVTPEFLGEQLDNIFTDIYPDAVKIGMVSSSGLITKIADKLKEYDAKNIVVDPESVELQEHLRHAVESGITFAEMEVSSQALKYNRVDNMQFDVGIFLNISEDHISPIEHPDFEDYFSSKLKIFGKSRYGVVNMDADFADRILKKSKVCEKVLTFSTKNPEADVYGYEIQKDGHETVFMVKTELFDEEFRLTMPGLFNVENALAVIAASILLEIPKEYMHSGLLRARSSGRMELYGSADKNLIAVVDYAHNKLSFEKLFSSIKDEYPDYNIVSIFGCPGKKAFIRRRDLGTVAGQYAKKVYLTAEDPGYEPVEQISKEIAQYVEAQNCPYAMIEDRGEAIKAAMDEAEGKTIFLITGKGNETRQKYGCEYLDCKSDTQYVKEYLAEYDKKHQ